MAVTQTQTVSTPTDILEPVMRLNSAIRVSEEAKAGSGAGADDAPTKSKAEKTTTSTRAEKK